MKRFILITFILFCLTNVLCADISGLIGKIKKLHDDYKHKEAAALIESSMGQASNNKERAELSWRLSRAFLYLGNISNDAKKPKKETLALYSKGEKMAGEAIKLDSLNPDALFWKSANMGRWGQVKGILDSLFKAKPMQKLLNSTIQVDAEHTDAFDVLGELYELVPGIPISFGNVNYSVSLGRRSVDLNKKNVVSGKDDEIQYAVYHHLANHLYKRNWSAAKRNKNQAKKKKNFDRAKTILKKYFYYEGTVKLKNMSDREEAMEIIKFVVNGLTKIPNKTFYQKNDLDKARETLAKWGG